MDADDVSGLMYTGLGIGALGLGLGMLGNLTKNFSSGATTQQVKKIKTKYCKKCKKWLPLTHKTHK